MMLGSEGATAIAPIEPVDFLVEERLPVGAIIGGAPESAVVESDVEEIGLAGHARDRASPAGAGGADLAPVHAGGEVGGLGEEIGRCREQRRDVHRAGEVSARHSRLREDRCVGVGSER